MAPSLTTSQTLLCPDCFEWPNADFLALVPSMTHGSHLIALNGRLQTFRGWSHV